MVVVEGGRGGREAEWLRIPLLRINCEEKDFPCRTKNQISCRTTNLVFEIDDSNNTIKSFRIVTNTLKDCILRKLLPNLSSNGNNLLYNKM